MVTQPSWTMLLRLSVITMSRTLHPLGRYWRRWCCGHLFSTCPGRKYLTWLDADPLSPTLSPTLSPSLKNDSGTTTSSAGSSSAILESGQGPNGDLVTAIPFLRDLPFCTRPAKWKIMHPDRAADASDHLAGKGRWMCSSSFRWRLTFRFMRCACPSTRPPAVGTPWTCERGQAYRIICGDPRPRPAERILRHMS